MDKVRKTEARAKRSYLSPVSITLALETYGTRYIICIHRERVKEGRVEKRERVREREREREKERERERERKIEIKRV